MRLSIVACVSLLLLSVQPSVYAKERNGSGHAKCTVERTKGGGSPDYIAGGIAGTALRRVPITDRLPLASLLTDTIIRKLDCKEQAQAATATDNSVRGGVGTTTTWESETRPGVKGSSTVRDQKISADGGSCMLVTDVVIVHGEETVVDKRMCRKPGGGDYLLAA